MIFTNGTRLTYWDKELLAAPVFCTLVGKVVAVTTDWEQAQDIVEKGIVYVQRISQTGIRVVMTPSEIHLRNEYRRQAGMKFPGAFIF